MYGVNFSILYSGKCASAHGKSNVCERIRERNKEKILAIVDGAAFGCEIEKVLRYLQSSKKDCLIYAPESFEYLILSAGILDVPRQVLSETYQYADSNFDFYIVVDDSQRDMLELTAKAYKSIRHKQRRAVDIIVNTERKLSRIEKKDSYLWKKKLRRRECCCMEREELMWLAFAKTHLDVARHLKTGASPY